MTCEEAELLLHALADDELDAGHARTVEEHVAACQRCATALARIHALRSAVASADLRFAAPADLRRRIETALPAPVATTDRARTMDRAGTTNRRTLLKGFAFGTVLSSALAASVTLVILRDDHDSRVLGEMVAAHVRSLQAEHLTDVPSGDQHTVKPWFNGRLDLAPPVPDLAAQGFLLLGGRLDYIGARPVAALVYRRRQHVINLFVGERLGGGDGPESIQGFHLRCWTAAGLSFCAVSDINVEELQEFAERFQAAARAGA